jgi:hypothetical protein
LTRDFELGFIILTDSPKSGQKFMKEVEKSWKDDKAYTNFWTRRPRNWERQVFGVIDTNESYYDIQLYNFMYNERCWRFDAAPFVESINTAYRFVCYYVIEYDKKKTICSRYDPSFGYFFKIFAFIYYKQHGFDPNLKLKMSYEQFLILNLDGSYKPLIPDDIKKNYEYYHLDDNIFRAEFVDYLESKFLEGKKEGLKKKVEDNMFISKEEFIEYLNDISIELKKRYYGLEIYKTNENSIIKKGLNLLYTILIFIFILPLIYMYNSITFGLTSSPAWYNLLYQFVFIINILGNIICYSSKKSNLIFNIIFIIVFIVIMILISVISYFIQSKK